MDDTGGHGQDGGLVEGQEGDAGIDVPKSVGQLVEGFGVVDMVGDKTEVDSGELSVFDEIGQIYLLCRAEGGNKVSDIVHYDQMRRLGIGVFGGSEMTGPGFHSLGESLFAFSDFRGLGLEQDGEFFGLGQVVAGGEP